MHVLSLIILITLILLLIVLICISVNNSNNVNSTNRTLKISKRSLNDKDLAKLLQTVKAGDIIITDVNETLIKGDVSWGSDKISNKFPGMMGILQDKLHMTSCIRGAEYLPEQKELQTMREKYKEYTSLFNLTHFAGYPVELIKQEAMYQYEHNFSKHLNQRLMSFLLLAQKEKGATIIILTSSPSLYVQGFYSKLGWQVKGVETQDEDGMVGVIPTQVPEGQGKRNILLQLQREHPKKVVMGFANDDVQWIRESLKSSKVFKVDALTESITPVK